MNTLHKKYPWIRTWKHSEYLSPQYYHKLLKPYIFKNKEDCLLFEDFLSELKNSPLKVLELGCGSGRGTSVFFKVFKASFLDVLDLSQQMLLHTKSNFHIRNAILSDTFNYMNTTTEKYDLVYSLWSFSHSLHQHLEAALSLNDEKERLSKILKKFILNNINKSGDFFIIHFDSQSDEQRILMKQWAKKSVVYDVGENQSLSYQIIIQTLNDLQNEKKISFTSEHLIGAEIQYENMDQVLETFLNFHLEGIWNNKSDFEIQSIIDEISDYCKRFINQRTGKISIRPGCFIIKIHKE